MAPSALIPVFNIFNPTPDLASSLVSAAATHGFLFIKYNSLLPFTASNIAETFLLSRKFFSSPPAEKETCRMKPNNRGWTSFGGETLDPDTQKSGDPKEAFNLGEFVNGKAAQPMPPAFVGHEAQLNEFSDACYVLCNQLLRLIAMGLDIEDETAQPVGSGAEWFATRHDPSKGDSGTILRLLHYPASHSAARIRAGAHSDYGSLTLLFRLPGQPGLEVQTPEGEWASVPVQPPGTEGDESPPILVNIGDLLSYWTGGFLKSTVHRVVGHEAGEEPEDRYSIAFFCHPNRDIPLVPVPSELVRRKLQETEKVNELRVGYGSGANAAASEADGRILTANEHLQGRLAATYGWSEAAVK